eukprot:982547-Pelagomonas_calceolata.AAC.5
MADGGSSSRAALFSGATHCILSKMQRREAPRRASSFKKKAKRNCALPQTEGSNFGDNPLPPIQMCLASEAIAAAAAASNGSTIRLTMEGREAGGAANHHGNQQQQRQK